MRKSGLQELRTALARVVHRSTLPYASLRQPAPGSVVSDQFLYRGDIAGTSFVAENTLALLVGRALPVLHELRLFDPEGQPVRTLEITSERFFETIPLTGIDRAFGSFMHFSRYDPEALLARGLDPGELDAHRQLRRLHRGYCLYRRTPRSVPAAVHGNFGGLVLKRPGQAGFQHLARRRGAFLYVPQYRFRPDQRVSLYVMNACRSSERVEVVREGGTIEQLWIPPLGTRTCRLHGVEGYLGLRSNLPMCRPVVFCEDDDGPDHFDVFHT